MSKVPEKKVIIAKVRKPRPFDLTFAKSVENNRILKALQGLEYDQGWQFLKQVFEANKQELGRQIITKIDIDGKILTNEELDILRIKYEYLDELLNKPDYFVKKLRTPETQDNNLDPYN